MNLGRGEGSGQAQLRGSGFTGFERKREMGGDGKRGGTEQCASRNAFALTEIDGLRWLRRRLCPSLLAFQDSVAWERFSEVGGNVGEHWKFVICHELMNDFTY